MNTLEFLGKMDIDKNINIKTNNNYYINSVQVISLESLGPTILKSSLTQIDTLTSLQVITSGPVTLGNMTASNITVTSSDLQRYDNGEITELTINDIITPTIENVSSIILESSILKASEYIFSFITVPFQTINIPIPGIYMLYCYYPNIVIYIIDTINTNIQLFNSTNNNTIWSLTLSVNNINIYCTLSSLSELKLYLYRFL
jgi:hypothetical protein